MLILLKIQEKKKMKVSKIIHLKISYATLKTNN